MMRYRNESIADRLARCAAERAHVLSLFDASTELYCVQVAELMQCKLGKAVDMLRKLHLAGHLVKRKAPAPRTGNGRIYYRLADAAMSGVKSVVTDPHPQQL